jgi:hypothetical protein
MRPYFFANRRFCQGENAGKMPALKITARAKQDPEAAAPKTAALRLSLKAKTPATAGKTSAAQIKKLPTAA